MSQEAAQEVVPSGRAQAIHQGVRPSEGKGASRRAVDQGRLGLLHAQEEAGAVRAQETSLCLWRRIPLACIFLEHTLRSFI